MTLQEKQINTLELSNHEVQDILEDMNMIDDNGNCPYTAEEIFKAGVEYAFHISLNWLKDNMDLEHDYPSSNEELINDFGKLYEEY
jgi:hypothetical protein